MKSYLLPAVFVPIFLIWLNSPVFSQSKRMIELENWLQENEAIEVKTVFDTLNSALKESKRTKKKSDEVSVLLHLSAMSIMRIKDFEKAVSYAKKIRDIAQKQQPSIFMVDYYNIMGEIYYYELMNKDKAIAYYDSAVSYGKIHFPKKSFVRAASNSALSFMNAKDFKKALKIFQEIDPKQFESNPHISQKLYSNIGVAYMHGGILDSVQFYFQKALNIALKTKSKSDDFKRHLNFGVFYQEIGNFEKAVFHLSEAEKLIDCNVLYRYKRLLQEAFADLYLSNNDFKKAHDYRKLERIYTDSINFFNLSEQSFSYEYKEKIKKLKFKNDILKLENTVSQRKIEIILLILFTLMTIVFLVFLRQREIKQKAQLKAEKEHLERINLEYEKEASERETASKSLVLLEKENLIQTISKRLKKAQDKFSEKDRPILNEIISELELSMNNKRWIEFETRFNKVHPEFLNKLKIDFPNLSPNDKNLCCFLLLNMTSKEISAITHQSVDSINMARIRLRKKLNLTNTKQDLSSFLAQYTLRNTAT